MNVCGAELSLPGSTQGTVRSPICCPLRPALGLPCATVCEMGRWSQAVSLTPGRSGGRSLGALT